MNERIRSAIAAAREAAAGDREALAAQRRAEVLRWRQPSSGSEPHRPEPWFSERAGRDPVWLEGAGGRGADRFVGFDERERPVLNEIRWGERFGSRLDEVWRHGDGWSECLLEREARRYEFDGARLAFVATSEPGLELWDEDRRRGEIVEVGEERIVAECYVAELEPDGRLDTLRRGVEIVERGDLDEEAALDRGLELARALEPDHVVYDHRRHRVEPVLRDEDELVELLVAAIERAVRAAVAQAGVPDPFVVELRLSEGTDWPPFARVGGESWRSRMTGLSPQDGAAVGSLYKAEPPHGATLDLTAFLGDEALRACREMNAALSHERDLKDPHRVRASRASGRIGRALAERLQRWEGVSEPFAALVHFDEQYRDVHPLPHASAAFRASIRSRRGQAKAPPAPAHTDRAALERLLAERGLEAHAHRLAHEVAQVGYRLVAGEGAGHLGGPSRLPPGERWPEGLTFLAAIDTRTIGGLPDGWMLFFADPEEWIEDDADAARLYFTTDPVPAEGPALRPRPVRAEATLTLPDGWDDGRRLGLDPAEAEAYDAVAAWLRYGDAGYDPDEPDHWVLGSITDVQGYGTEDDEVLLLHLAWDEPLGFEHLDGGDLRFSIPRAALEAGDWSRAVAASSSG